MRGQALHQAVTCCAGVILTTAMTAALYKRQTKAVERDNAAAQTRMTAVANQAFRCTADTQHTAK